MDMGQLRTFLAVYRTGTVTRAARTVHLTQPAVSLQVQALERQLGRSLFRRLPRGMDPTPAGHELARAVGPHLDALEESVGGWSAPGGRDAGNAVFLGGPSEFVTARILPLVAPLLADGLRLRVFLDTDEPIVQRLVDEELDLAVVTGAVTSSALASQPLALETHVLVGAPTRARQLEQDQAAGVPSRAEALERMPLLAHGEDMPLVRPYWIRAFGRELQTSAAVVANSLPSLLALTVAGVGITVLPDHVCAVALAAGELEVLHRPEEPPRIQLALAWRAGSLGNGRVSEVHQLIAAAGAAGQL